MKVETGIGWGRVCDAEHTVSHEQFTHSECAWLADLLESHNAPNNTGSAVRRLTDMLWALQNDTDAFIITAWDD